MMSVALKMLVGDKLKYIGLVAGIAFAALLVVQQAGILVGLTHQTGSFIRDTSQADLWVMEPQVRFSQDTLPISDGTLLRTRGVEGVDWAVPIYQGFLKARLEDGTRAVVILIGLDDATLMGGPPEMVTGQLADLRTDKAVLIDYDARDSKFKLRRSPRPEGEPAGLRMGDSFAINDVEVRVAGEYRASKSFFWEPVVYTTYSRALEIAPRERRLMTYVMVKVKEGYDHREVAERIRAATGLEARTSDEFIQITADFILKETGILVNFGLAVGLGFLVGTLVSGQMLYNFTVDNLRYYGTLKAMGATNGRLVAMVLGQAVVVACIGYGIGLGAGSLLGQVVGDAGLAFMMPWQVPVGGFVAITLCCVIAGLISVIRVLKLEPAVVFRS